MITETDKAYLAGLIDGEGCISILSNMQKGVKKHHLRLIVTSTDKAILDYLHDKFKVGAVNNATKEGSGSPNRRATYIWGTSSKEASGLLEAVYPYLMMKREQADIAQLFQATMRTHSEVGSNGRGVKGSRTPDELIYLRERYKQALSQLKGYKGKRGRPPTQPELLP